MLEEHTATLQSFIEERQAILGILDNLRAELASQSEEHKEHGAGARIMLEAVDRRLGTLLFEKSEAERELLALRQAAQEKLAAELRNAEKAQLKKKKKRKPG